MKLYKFRPLGDELSFCRAKHILESEEFHFSHFWELNDPMEGVYEFKKGELAEPAIRELFDGKSRRLICSFSDGFAVGDPALWGYYANGFKGIAIEVEVDCTRVTKIDYVDKVPSWTDTDRSALVDQILTTKLKRWEHEHEYRALVDSDTGIKLETGSITCVYFGDPHARTINRDQIMRKSSALRAFSQYRSNLEQVARREGIACKYAAISGNTVEFVNKAETA